mgnify:CR=1 FL=1
MAGSTVAQMATKLENAAKALGLSLDAEYQTRSADYASQAKKHIVAVMGWWYTQAGTTAAGDTAAWDDEFEQMWFNLACSDYLRDLGAIQQSASHYAAFERNVAMFNSLRPKID